MTEKEQIQELIEQELQEFKEEAVELMLRECE